MRLNLTGKRFGRLIGIRPIGQTKWHEVIWLFKCDCGKKKYIVGKVVKRGDISSCGCLGTETRANNNIIHGASNTRAYRAWHNMKVRCNWKKSKSYKDYGARGITVCNRWRKFSNFLSDMKQPELGMTLERIDNNKSYCSENCRWASRLEQGNNKRNNIVIEHHGEKKTLSQWANTLNLKYSTLRQRLFVYKWSLEDCFIGEKI